MHRYGDLINHVGHELKCVKYGTENVAIECITCNEILVDFDKFYEAEEDILAVATELGYELTEGQMDIVLEDVRKYDYSDYNDYIRKSIEAVIAEKV